MHHVASRILRPHLAVHIVMVGHDHGNLAGVVIHALWQTPGSELLSCLIKSCERPLEHRAQPNIAGFIHFHLKYSDGESRLYDRRLIFGDFSCLWIQFSHNHFSKIGVPDHPFGVHDGVMRHRFLTRQVVLRDDHLRRLARRTRQRFQFVGPGIAGAEIDRAHPLGLLLQTFRVSKSFVDLDSILRMRRIALGRVTGHALEQRNPFVRGVRGLYDSLHGVAGHAVQQKTFLFFRARHAEEPFRVGQLRAEVCRLVKLQVRRRCLVCGELHGSDVIQIVAARPHFQGIGSRLHALAGKSVTSLLIARDRHRNSRALLLGADDHALHGAFLFGRDLPGHCNRTRCLSAKQTRFRINQRYSQARNQDE